ncbi:MAG: hypothetical protein IPL71_22820, partial [Anaerolineales bacterium]|nr:hypothetical protein [Anaerolineales bacterium]
LTLNKDGSLSIAFETGALTESARRLPTAEYQRQTSGESRCCLQIRGQEVAFRWAHTRELRPDDRPDPDLEPFLPRRQGSDIDTAIAVDGVWEVYVAGGSDTTWGTPVLADNAGNNAFAAKLNSSGVLQWNTFLGGSGSDVATAIAVDGSGNVYGGF